MASIYDLSERQIYKIRSIDPYLSQGWQKSLFEVLPLLDKESQQTVYQRVLEPRGIFYDRKARQFGCESPTSLRTVLNNCNIEDKEFQRTTEHMQEFVLPTPDVRRAEDIADQLEAILSQYDRITIDESSHPKIKHNIRQAFLYEVAMLIDNTEFEVTPGIRRMNDQMFRAYVKEVYIKQQIQGWDFRHWDAVDIQGIPDIPEWIKKAAKIRQFYLVETAQFWFLVGQAERTTQNPYSLRRFLYEDIDPAGYVFLNHLVVPRALAEDSRVIELMEYCLSRFYTLDRNVGEAVRNFIRESKEHQQKYLRPILRKNLRHDGLDIEQVIHSRMLKYEKQITVLILNRLTKLIDVVSKDTTDQDYLFYHFDGIVKQMLDNVEDFRLQPATRYSNSAEQMSMRLTCYQVLLKKIRFVLCDRGLTEKQKEHDLSAPLFILKNQLTKAEEKLAELKGYRRELTDFQERKEQPGFLDRFRRDKTFDFTYEDIAKGESDIAAELFFSIIRLEKQKRELMVYPEHEFYQNFDEEYRHYAFADGKLGIGQLPKLIRLPEDRRKFSINAIRRAVYFDIFKAKQDWHFNA